MPQKVSGRASWFGGPNDSQNTGTATGASDAAPGIAVYNKRTLGGYWRVTMNGKSTILKQTDIGPAPWTGKVVDVTSGALKRFGYNERTFPTGGKISATYLGKSKPGNLRAGKGDTSSVASPSPKSKSVPGVDPARAELLMGYLSNRHDPNALLNLAQSIKGK